MRSTNKKAFVGGIALGLVLLVGFLRLANWWAPVAPAQRAGASLVHSAPTPTRDPNWKEKLLRDAQGEARRGYLDTLNQGFHQEGVDASASQSGPQLVITSEVLERKAARDYLLRRQFDAQARQALCKMGFRSLALRGLGIEESYVYPLGCPETGEEKHARLEAEEVARQNYVADMQARFANDPGLRDWRILPRDRELVLALAASSDLSAAERRQLASSSRGIWESFARRSEKRLCAIGFRGLRVQTDDVDPGAFLAFTCGKGALVRAVCRLPHR
jgi:hypothetical protein